MSLDILCFELQIRTAQEEHVPYAKTVMLGLKVCRTLVRWKLGLLESDGQKNTLLAAKCTMLIWHLLRHFRSFDS